MDAVVTPSNVLRRQGIWVSGESASGGQLLILRKSHRGNPPIKMATAATATTAPASRLRSALSPTAPPVFPELAARVGSKGFSWAVTAFVAPEVGVDTPKMENGSPVDAIPVGVAVIEMSLSSSPNPAHVPLNSTPSKAVATSMEAERGGR